MVAIRRTSSWGMVALFGLTVLGCGQPSQKPPAVSGPGSTTAGGNPATVDPTASPSNAPTTAKAEEAPQAGGEPLTEADLRAPVPEAVVKATADEYFQLQKSDKSAWQEKFGGKIVELTGTLLRYESRDVLGLSAVLIGDPENPFDVIEAKVSEDWLWTKHQPGSTVTVVGTSGTFSPELEKAVLVRSEPGAELPAFTVEELLKAEPEALSRPGLVKTVKVSGTFRRFDDDFATTGMIYLRGEEDKDLVSVQFRDYEPRHVKHLKPGDRVVVLGRAMRASEEQASVGYALLVEPLPKLPEQPKKAARKNKYDREFTHLLFTPELIDAWLRDDPRALDVLVKRATFYAPINQSMGMVEVAGTVKSVEPNKLSPNEIHVRLEEVKGADLRFVFEKDDPLLARLKPGTKATFRGMFHVSMGRGEEYGWVNETSAVVK